MATDEHFAAELLAAARTIAVVGFSTDETKASHRAPMLLVERGWDVVPVNPTTRTVAGRTSYESVGAVQGAIDIVNVFRPARDAPEVARQAVEAGAKVLWLQLGIVSSEARAIAEAGGLAYVEDLCAGALARRLDLHPAAGEGT